MTPEEFVRLAIVEKIQRDRRQGLRPDPVLVEGLRAFLSELVLSSGVVRSPQESSPLAAVAQLGNAESGGNVPLAMSREEAAHELRVSVETLDRRIASGDLPVTRSGRRVLITREALENYLRGETA